MTMAGIPSRSARVAVVIALLCAGCGVRSDLGDDGGWTPAEACEATGSGSGQGVECPALCAKLVAIPCPNGPQMEECLADCATLQACPAFDGYIDCAGSDPEWKCSGLTEKLVPATCEGEWACAKPCVEP
jgi:hypothetical protein